MFVIPAFACLFLTLFRSSLLGRAKKEGHFNSLTWQQMEFAAKEFYKKKGYKVSLKGGAKADGGIDLIAKKGREKILVQVKHYKSKVGVKVVREMLGVLVDSKEYNAVHVVSSTDFTKPAKELANRQKVRLIGKKELFS